MVLLNQSLGNGKTQSTAISTVSNHGKENLFKHVFWYARSVINNVNLANQFMSCLTNGDLAPGASSKCYGALVADGMLRIDCDI